MATPVLQGAAVRASLVEGSLISATLTAAPTALLQTSTGPSDVVAGGRLLAWTDASDPASAVKISASSTLAVNKVTAAGPPAVYDQESYTWSAGSRLVDGGMALTASSATLGSAQVALVSPCSAAGMFNLTSTVQSGIATMLATQATVTIPQTLLTNNAVVLVTWLQPPPANGILSVAITPNVGFVITSAAAPAANTAIGYFVVHV